MEQDIKSIINLIQNSPLDQTVKDILIRDLESEGLTDFLKEQIKAYCSDGIKKLDEKIEEAESFLSKKTSA